VLRKFWLLFAQACTLVLAALFVVATLRPDLLPRFSGTGNVVLVQEANGPAVPATGAPAGDPSASFAGAAKAAMPAVVNVFTAKEMRGRNPLLDDSLLRRYFPDLPNPQSQVATSLGSGVIVAREGFVLTNHHVIEGADDIQIVLVDGRRLTARVRGTDPETDLAVLKVEAKDLPAITLGDLSRVQIGDPVLAIGNPFGLGTTVTSGIVSALGRPQLGISRYTDFIQTDAAINPGNSGGALVDAAGRLIGINSTIYTRSGGSMGIGFAIPVTLARDVMAQIIEKGEVTRGWFGIGPQDLDEDIARAIGLDRTEGVVIVSMVRGGPGDRAGLRVRDVVVEIEGRPTPNTSVLLSQIAQLAPGANARVTVLRDGRSVGVDVVVGRRPKSG
jgi:serine protease DegQ